MINVRVNNLTAQTVGYHQVPALPRTGDGIFFSRGHTFTNRFEVVDVAFREMASGLPLEIEIFVLERPPAP